MRSSSRLAARKQLDCHTVGPLQKPYLERPHRLTLTLLISRSACWRADRPEGTERTRLAAEFGALLWQERQVGRGRTLVELAARTSIGIGHLSQLQRGLRRPSETSTRRLALALREDGTAVDAALLDLQLQRAAGPSLRRWRRRPLAARTQRAYDKAVRLLDSQVHGGDTETTVTTGRLLANLEAAR